MSVPAAGYWSTQGIALAFKINTSFMLVCAKACATISENTKTWKAGKLCTRNKYDLAPVKFQHACVALVGNMLDQQGWALGWAVYSLILTHFK